MSSKPRKSFAQRAASMGILLVALVAMPLTASADRTVNVRLNAGETYAINNVVADGSPQVQFSDDSDAFSVQTKSASELTVLGVKAGKGSIRVKTAEGYVKYMIDVSAIANAHDRLAPGAAPAVLGAPALSRDETKSPAAGPLDAGAGPAGTDGTKIAAAAPSSPPSGAKAASGSGASMTTAVVPADPVGPGAAKADSSGTDASLSSPSTPLTKSQAMEQSAAIPGEKYKNNPPAIVARDSMAREPAIGGRHPLPNDALSMMAGTSRVYDFNIPVRRVSIADTKIADIQVINPRQLMVIGHDPGFTTLVVWDNQGNYQERQVRIEKEGHQQVLLDVTVAEINKTKLENSGIDYSLAFTRAGLSFAGLPGGVATPYSPTTSLTTAGAGGTSAGGIPPPGGNPFPLLFSNNLTYALSARSSAIDTNTFFEFLESHELGRILARPRLLANSGEEAKFLSGGEIPIVIAQALNTSVVFKQFGTSVVFLPTVVGTQDIELVVKPEVSKPDFSQGVALFGFTVPAFITRRAETQVRMRENQTLIIAGLILEDTRSQIRKIPYLGDIPYAGALFRNTSYQKTKTELVMSVTPSIVRPIPENSELDLPTDRGPMNWQEIRTAPVTPGDITRPRIY